MKRIIAWALCLLIAGSAALAETYVVNLYGSEEREGCALLITEDGELLTPLDTYASIYELTPKGTPEAQRRFCAQTLKVDVDLSKTSLEMVPMDAYYRLALMDATGKLLTGFDYWNMEWAGGSIRFNVPGQDSANTGIMDLDGHIIIEPVYHAIETLDGGRWLALAEDKKSKAYRFSIFIVDENGNVTDTGLHTSIDILPQCDGEFCPVYHVEEYESHTVYLNRDGEVCFGRTFDSAEPFMGDCAVVEIDEKNGLINREGQMVVEPVYSYLYHLGDAPGDVYASDSDGLLVVFDAATGAELFRKKFENVDYLNVCMIAPELLWVYCGNHCECYRTDGTLVASFPDDENNSVQYARCSPDALRFIESVNPWPESKTHLIDEQGRQIGGDYRGMIDYGVFDGHPLFSCYTYHISTNRDGEKVADWHSWRYGVLDENGNELLKPEYLNEVQILSPNRFWVTANDRSGLIDASGKWYYAISDYDSLMD